MESPKKYVPRFMLPPEERVYSPDRIINNIMGKMSPQNFDALTNYAKAIEILDEPERLKLKAEDLEKVKPVANKLIINVMECNEKGSLLEIYSKFLYEMTTNPTIKRQGRALMMMVNEEISSFIGTYIGKKENTLEDTLKLYSVIKFIGCLYQMNHKAVPVDYILMIADQFCSAEQINVLGRIIQQNLTKLMKEEAFKAKSSVYRKIIEDYVKGDSRGPMYFLLKEMLEKW
jgi:hypothetical protein